MDLIVYTVKVYSDKTEWFNSDGKRHRDSGLPAIEYPDGSKEWYLNGKRHREDGPAIEWANGHKEWWLDGQETTEEEVMKKQHSSSCDGKVVEIDGKKYKLVEV